jgi:hypothetical protein
MGFNTVILILLTVIKITVRALSRCCSGFFTHLTVLTVILKNPTGYNEVDPSVVHFNVHTGPLFITFGSVGNTPNYCNTVRPDSWNPLLYYV